MQLDLTKIPKEEKEDAILMFKTRGNSNHSREGLTVMAVIEYCVTNKIPFLLKGHPDFGYYIEKVENFD